MESLIWVLVSLAALFLFLRWIIVRARKPKTTTSTSKVTAQFGSNEGDDNA